MVHAALMARRETYDGWIGMAFPDRLTCYHISELIRAYLRAQPECAQAPLSVCELFHRRGWPGVGPAVSFLSHVQSEHPEDALSAMGSADEPIWVDVFSLRQTATDAWDSREVVSLIQDIGRVCIQIDRMLTYTTRSFCILEAFAAINGDAQINVRLPDAPFCSCEGCTLNCESGLTVDTRSASTRTAEDKAQIDEYVERYVGFDAMDEVIQQRLRLAFTNHRRRAMQWRICFFGLPLLLMVLLVVFNVYVIALNSFLDNITNSADYDNITNTSNVTITAYGNTSMEIHARARQSPSWLGMEYMYLLFCLLWTFMCLLLLCFFRARMRRAVKAFRMAPLAVFHVPPSSMSPTPVQQHVQPVVLPEPTNEEAFSA